MASEFSGSPQHNTCFIVLDSQDESQFTQYDDTSKMLGKLEALSNKSSKIPFSPRRGEMPNSQPIAGRVCRDQGGSSQDQDPGEQGNSSDNGGNNNNSSAGSANSGSGNSGSAGGDAGGSGGSGGNGGSGDGEGGNQDDDDEEEEEVDPSPPSTNSSERSMPELIQPSLNMRTPPRQLPPLETDDDVAIIADPGMDLQQPIEISTGSETGGGISDAPTALASDTEGHGQIIRHRVSFSSPDVSSHSRPSDASRAGVSSGPSTLSSLSTSVDSSIEQGMRPPAKRPPARRMGAQAKKQRVNPSKSPESDSHSDTTATTSTSLVTSTTTNTSHDSSDDASRIIRASQQDMFFDEEFDFPREDPPGPNARKAHTMSPSQTQMSPTQDPMSPTELTVPPTQTQGENSDHLPATPAEKVCSLSFSGQCMVVSETMDEGSDSPTSMIPPSQDAFDPIPRILPSTPSASTSAVPETVITQAKTDAAVARSRSTSSSLRPGNVAATQEWQPTWSLDSDQLRAKSSESKSKSGSSSGSKSPDDLLIVDESIQAGTNLPKKNVETKLVVEQTTADVIICDQSQGSQVKMSQASNSKTPKEKTTSEQVSVADNISRDKPSQGINITQDPQMSERLQAWHVDNPSARIRQVVETGTSSIALDDQSELIIADSQNVHQSSTAMGGLASVGLLSSGKQDESSRPPVHVMASPQRNEQNPSITEDVESPLSQGVEKSVSVASQKSENLSKSGTHRGQTSKEVGSQHQQREMLQTETHGKAGQTLSQGRPTEVETHRLGSSDNQSNRSGEQDSSDSSVQITVVVKAKERNTPMDIINLDDEPGDFLQFSETRDTHLDEDKTRDPAGLQVRSQSLADTDSRHASSQPMPSSLSVRVGSREEPGFHLSLPGQHCQKESENVARQPSVTTAATESRDASRETTRDHSQRVTGSSAREGDVDTTTDISKAPAPSLAIGDIETQTQDPSEQQPTFFRIERPTMEMECDSLPREGAPKSIFQRVKQRNPVSPKSNPNKSSDDEEYEFSGYTELESKKNPSPGKVLAGVATTQQPKEGVAEPEVIIRGGGTMEVEMEDTEDYYTNIVQKRGDKSNAKKAKEGIPEPSSTPSSIHSMYAKGVTAAVELHELPQSEGRVTGNHPRIAAQSKKKKVPTATLC